MNTHKYFYYLDSKYLSQNIVSGKVQEKNVFEQIEAIFGITGKEIAEKMENTSFIPLGESEGMVLEIPLPSSMYISIDHRNERSVLYSELTQIIGRVDSFGGGVNALEQKYDGLLSPKDTGQIYYEKFSNYARLGEVVAIQQPKDGGILKITIDLNLQRIMAERLHEGVNAYGAKAGSGILIESKTGKVRAMYSTTGINDAALSVFEPGSALKPFIFAASLKFGLLDDEQRFDCNGKIKPYKDLPTIINDTHIHGEITTIEALAESCNVATILIALDFLEEMGDWTWYNELFQAGFGRKTGIEFPGEVNGILHLPNDWNRLTGIQMSIGQGIAVTALQLVTAFNIFANNGRYIAPTLLEERGNPPNERRVYPQVIADRITKMLEKTVLSGTGTAAKTPLTNVAGKTGTAQKAFPGLGYVKGKYFSSFIGYFPAENPVYTLLVSFDEPQGDIYYGGDISAPVYRKIVEDYLTLLESAVNKEIQPLFVKSWKMPDFSGLTRKDTLDILEKLGIASINVTFIGEGVVVSQIPEPETPVSDVKQITLLLENEVY
jgi:cell division protein FtsI (penicillin-binding protein 3)